MSNARPIDLDDLLLDPANPRLPSTVGRSQSEMIVYLARTTSITEIMTAIGENGYFPGEPLIVVADQAGKFVVVEGNRRLTALKLLADPSLMGTARKIQEIAASAAHKPNEIPCVVFQNRDEVINYLGYRHITGVKQWEPLAKARYIASYFDDHTDKSQEPRLRYSQVARGIGSQAPYIKRQLDGLAVYECAEQKNFFNIDGLDEENISFSLLSTATGYESILSFVSSVAHPYVEKQGLKKDCVAHLCRWMFSQDSQGVTVLGDSRNIQKLAVILDDKDALAALIEGDSLERAYAKTRGVAEDFLTVLVEAEGAITRAVSMISIVDVDESHETRIMNIFKQARALRSLAEDPS